MKGQGLIRFFIIAFAIVCGYQLLFSCGAKSVESDAKAFSKGNKKAYQSYIDSVQDRTALNLGFAEFTYKQCRNKQINLGLDLQGGMNVVLEVSVPDVIKGLAGYSNNPLFTNALDAAVKAQSDSQDDFVTLFIKQFKAKNPSKNLASIFATIENKDRVNINTSDADVEAFLRQESEGAIDRSFNIISTRVDKFGVANPNIQRQQGTGRINVELPGVDNPERVRKLLQGTAKLEFWETFENSEVINSLDAANKLLGENAKAAKKAKNTVSVGKDGTLSGSLDSTASQVTAATDTTKSLLDKLDAAENKDTKDTTKKTDAASKAQIQAENPLFALLNPAIFTKNNQQQVSPGPVVGYSLVKDTAKVNNLLAKSEVKALMPKNLRFMWTIKPEGDKDKFLQLVAIKTNNDGRSKLDGGAISNANRSVDQIGNNEVSMQMNSDGAKVWQKLTRDNVGKSVAIALDDYVYSYPRVNAEIAGGNSSISGSFTPDEADDLSNVLKAGKLPAPCRILEEAVVGASLGQDAVNSGMWASILGLLAVFLFAFAYYRQAGLVTDIALIFNLFFTFGIMASLGAVLTLPGIAGLALSIGMAVDANVLIYERIREELDLGKSLRQAVTDGYWHAASAIIDSNVTTLLVGIILYIFGKGPIKGFATTLVIGICCSLFTAIFISRLIFEWRLAQGKEISFASEATNKIFRNMKLNFLGKRKLMYIVSSVVIGAGIIAMLTSGFSLGVDFQGGRSYVLQLPAGKNISDVRAALTKEFTEAAPEVKTYGSTDDKFKVTTAFLAKDNSDAADVQVLGKLYKGLEPVIGGISSADFAAKNVLSSQKVGPTIVDDIKASAGLSTILAIVAIAVYILIRFRKWEYSLGAIIAMAHDVLVILAIYAIFWRIMPFSMDIDQAFIAALLTIAGYSINDTVVVYDRLREYIGLKRKGTLDETIADAVNSTLSRTLVTAVTTAITVLFLFFMGGEVLRSFSFAILVGLVVGTYSSIFIASSVVLDIQKRNEAKGVALAA